MSKDTSSTKRRGRSNQISSNVLLCAFMTFSSLIFFGVMFMTYFIPNPTGHSMFSTGISGESTKLSQKLLQWLPRGAAINVGNEPDWNLKFWTPIDLEVNRPYQDSLVTLCQLDFRKYNLSPHKFAMFRDLVAMSGCTGANRRREKLNAWLQILGASTSSDRKSDADGDKPLVPIEPTAFIFHESRVGSTLIANNLGSDPFSLVFSESSPTANALLHCSGCTPAEQIGLFRSIVYAMGSSKYHNKLFFKFQSITTTKMKVALEAFPDTPWIFIYRSPVQTMMSHLDPAKSSVGAPCLRSMRSPPDEVVKSLSILPKQDRPKEAWCAAHLKMLCTSAIDAFEAHGLFAAPDNRQRGFLVNYDSLPGIIGQILLPFMGIEPSESWLRKMQLESQNYSKGKSQTKVFVKDSTDKEERATSNIRQYSESILSPTYSQLETLSKSVFLKLGLMDAIINDAIDWKSFSSIPNELNEKSLSLLQSTESNSASFQNVTILKKDRHSQFTKQNYQPWAPFSNSHRSRAFDAPTCNLHPDSSYPMSYNITALTSNWNTDSSVIPPFHYDSLCHFDYSNATELQAAYNYRKADVPFVVYNIPQLDAVVKKWGDVDYIHSKLGSKVYRTEASETNHFMYWRGGGGPFLRNKDGSKWHPPTSIISTTFQEWLELAVKGQNQSIDDRTHQYFRVSSDSGNRWLFDELPFFNPVENLFMVNPKEQRGIHCRFGMRSVIAEAHFDGSRNSVVMIGGLRRWILTHPKYCSNMYMLRNSHPSARHSDVDWSNPDLAQFPDFANVQSNEVILQPGDFLYVPTYWIHYIVSLNINYQCNTRSGKTSNFDSYIKTCGF